MIRNFATITISDNPTYTFDAYIGCDQVKRAMLAPSGNWYVISEVSILFDFNTIIQKVHRT